MHFPQKFCGKQVLNIFRNEWRMYDIRSQVLCKNDLVKSWRYCTGYKVLAWHVAVPGSDSFQNQEWLLSIAEYDIPGFVTSGCAWEHSGIKPEVGFVQGKCSTLLYYSLGP